MTILGTFLDCHFQVPSCFFFVTPFSRKFSKLFCLVFPDKPSRQWFPLLKKFKVHNLTMGHNAKCFTKIYRAMNPQSHDNIVQGAIFLLAPRRRRYVYWKMLIIRRTRKDAYRTLRQPHFLSPCIKIRRLRSVWSGKSFVPVEDDMSVL